jgi:hypothetical protein
VTDTSGAPAARSTQRLAIVEELLKLVLRRRDRRRVAGATEPALSAS